MPTNGMTIDGLNTVSSLTAQDEVPVWDKEASGEPTRKITAQNMTASVKTLGSLVNTSEMNNAIQQSTADVIRTGDVVNSLTSTATDKPLSANMGKALNDNLHYQQATVTVTTNENGNAELYYGSDRIPICAKCNTSDNVAHAIFTRNGAIWVRVLSWDYAPVKGIHEITYYYIKV